MGIVANMDRRCDRVGCSYGGRLNGFTRSRYRKKKSRTAEKQMAGTIRSDAEETKTTTR